MPINWFSVIISGIIPLALGAVWYHPKLFGNAWMKGIGMTEEKMKSANMPLTYGLAFVMALILTMFLIDFNNGIGQEGEFDTFGHGAWHGVFVSIFTALPILVTKKLFEQTSWKNLLINWGYWVVAMAIMGGVVDAMNHWNAPC